MLFQRMRLQQEDESDWIQSRLAGDTSNIQTLLRYAQLRNWLIFGDNFYRRNCTLPPFAACDPAGPLFFRGNSINKKDAKYLQVIHTNPGGPLTTSSRGPFGNAYTSGTIDFWFNPPSAPVQPICRHNRTLRKT